MISREEHYGGCLWLENQNATLDYHSPRLVVMKNATAGKNIQLPDATQLSLGGPLHVIINDGSQSIDIQDGSGSSILTLASGKAVTLLLLSNSNTAGEWQTIVKDMNAQAAVYNEDRAESIPMQDNSPGEPETISCGIPAEPNTIWRLVDCDGVEPDIYTTTDLTMYEGRIVKLASSGKTDPCWIVSSITASGDESTIEVQVKLDFDNCDDCTGATSGLPDCGAPPYDATISWHCLSGIECQTQEQAIAEWEAFIGRTVSCVTIISQSDQSCGDGPNDIECPFTTAGVNYVPV